MSPLQLLDGDKEPATSLSSGCWGEAQAKGAGRKKDLLMKFSHHPLRQIG